MWLEVFTPEADDTMLFGSEDEAARGLTSDQLSTEGVVRRKTFFRKEEK